MSPDDPAARLRAGLPPPSAALRAQVLAAAHAAWRVPVTPWWAQLRTWAAAAVLAIACNLLLNGVDLTPPHPITPLATRSPTAPANIPTPLTLHLALMR